MPTPFTTTDKRFNPDGNQTYDICHLWESHHEIKRLLLLGYKNVDIARIVGCTPQTVSNIRNNPLMREQLVEMEGRRDEEAISIGKRVMDAAPIAIDLLTQSMESAMDNEGDDKDVRSQGVRSAIAVLDHAHPKTTNAAIIHGHVTLGQIDAIKKRLTESRLHPDNDVEDAEVIAESVEVGEVL